MNKVDLESYIAESQPNICQICILKDGQELYSHEWNGYKRTDCTHIMSATKSVMALLVGIAVEKGMIGSVDDKVLSYFPDYQVKRGEKTICDVTVKHLLTMRAPYKGKGDQIVSQRWLEEMTTPRTVESKYFRGMSYGYLWWIVHPGKGVYAAIGNSGNVIYVNPDTNIVAAVSSYFKPTVFDRVDFLEDVLLPAIEIRESECLVF